MSESTGMADPDKPVHTIVLDAGPLIKNVPPISTLLGHSHALVTTPAVISEIRDPNARHRIESLYLPFVTQRRPKPSSLSFVAEFAKKTGDRAVLSRTDLEVLALAYDVECERNGGDWRLRRVPGQKGINGMPPAKAEEEKVEGDKEDEQSGQVEGSAEGDAGEITAELATATLDEKEETIERDSVSSAANTPEESAEAATEKAKGEENSQEEEEEDESDSDAGGWITPSNIKKRQAKDEAIRGTAVSEPQSMQAATITTDFAMQNVLIQMNLNLLSTSTLQRIRQLKSYILRCHGCFTTTKEMSKQFCPRCGQPTLTRVSCSTSANGTFKMHLKKNMQWNTRGNRYSVPKPVAGNAAGKNKRDGGGKGGWGTELILAEDQKEYVRALADEKRRNKKERDLMDQDYLPGILSGERNQGGKSGGRVKVGAGRNVNSKKRR